MTKGTKLEFTFNTPIVGVDPRTGKWSDKWRDALTVDFRNRLYNHNAITEGYVGTDELWVRYDTDRVGGTHDEIVAHVQACVAGVSDSNFRSVRGAVVTSHDSILESLEEAAKGADRWERNHGTREVDHHFRHVITDIAREIQVYEGQVDLGLFPMAKAAGVTPEASPVIKEDTPRVPTLGVVAVKFPSDLLSLHAVTTEAGEFSSDLMAACTQSLRDQLTIDGVYDIRIGQRWLNIFWRWDEADPDELEALASTVLNNAIVDPVRSEEPQDRTGLFFPFHRPGADFELDINSGPSIRVS